MNAVLCVDIGTSSLKAAFISEAGKEIAFSRRPFLLSGTVHASKEWLPALQNAVQELFSQSPECAPSGICVSGNGPTLVAPSGETLLWNESAVPLSTPSLFIPRIIAFKNKFTAVWNRSSRIYSGPEYLLWLLTGASCTILPSESYRDAYWTEDELLRLGLSREECQKLPGFAFPSQRLAGLSHQAASFLSARQASLPEGLPVFCGAPDFISALVGTASVEKGILCDRAGSSEGINLCTDVPLFGEKIRTLPSVIPRLWNASVLIEESGSRFSSFKQKIERETGVQTDYSALVEKIIADRGADASLEQGKHLMTQIALKTEDSISILRQAAEKKGLPFPSEMRISGGQARSPLWNQMKADITGMSIAVPACPDAELLGDAAFAFTSLGLFPDIASAAKSLFTVAQLFVPHPNGESS